MISPTVILGFFVGLFIVLTFVRIHDKRKARKENLLSTPRPVNRSVDCAVIFDNKFIGIAVSTAMQTVFSNINDIRVKTQVFDILSNYTLELGTASNTITIPTLSKMLIERANSESDMEVSAALKKLSNELITQLSTMVCDVHQYTVSTQDVSRIFTFCLKSVELVDVRVYA